MYYSITTSGFYPESLKADYIKAGTFPDDAIELTPEEVETYQGKQPPEGKQLGSVNGRPAWVDIPPLSEGELAKQRITEIDAELARLDTEAIRPLRAIQAGTDSQYDRDKLADLELQAAALRTEREGLI